MVRQQKPSDSNQYDAIAIGSGIGGLTVAALLAKFNHKRVLILEQHSIIGGLTQEFKRQGFHWNVGVHVVGDLGEGDPGRAVFDYITDGQEYYAPIIISDAGAYNTYTKLIPEKYATAYREEIEAFPKGYSPLILFVGLKESPAKLGIDTPNYWIHTSYDHDLALAEQLESPEKLPTSCYLSFPSLKEPTVTRHTAEIMVLANYDWFTKWQGQPWQKRESDYYELKEKIARKLIKFVESYYPGFSDAIAYYELATPLTVEYFDGSDRGTIYGIPSIPARFERPWIGSKTPIENLYLTGTDALGHGIIGAMMGGVQTAGILNGALGFLKIMSAILKKSGRSTKPGNTLSSV